MRAAALMGDTPWLERQTDAASPGSARPATPEPAEERAVRLAPAAVRRFWRAPAPPAPSQRA